MGFFPFFDPTYMLYMLPAIILMVIAQIYVNSSYRKWSQVPTRSRMTGSDAAQYLMRRNGLTNIRLQGIEGQLTDQYDPSQKVLRLSQDVAAGQSVASVAIAAHELGHAMQDAQGYLPMQLRSLLVPAVNIGSTLGWLMIIGGLLLRITGLAWLGILVFSAGVLFALATLPVELNASSRARQMLAESGVIMGEDEQRGVNTVLNAAALTYVAALATSLLQLLYFVTLVGGIGGRRRS